MQIFQQPNKKLSLKFRPSDPFTNAANASGQPACGLLLRVRRRKPRGGSEETNHCERSKETGKINLDELGTEPTSAEAIHDLLLDNELSLKRIESEEHSIILDGKKYRREDLRLEDNLLSNRQFKAMKAKIAWRKNVSKEYNLKIPKTLETTTDPNLKVETLGVVHKSYDFNGKLYFQLLNLILTIK